MATNNNRETARAILIRFGIDPSEQWELLDAIHEAITDSEFRAMFGSDNPVIKLAADTSN